MNEKEWVKNVVAKYLSQDVDWSKHREKDWGEIKVGTEQGLPYVNEITQYGEGFKEQTSEPEKYKTDLLIYEQKDGIIIPRIVFEAKLRLTTHGAITYAHKAQDHKNITPFLRYGIMISNCKGLPGRLFWHGLSNFDFMIGFKGEELDCSEKESLLNLVKSEIGYSKKIAEVIYESRKNDRKRYFFMQKQLVLSQN